jgi:hypothetical protein
LGATKIQDLINHPVFAGADLQSIYDNEPALTPRQKKLTKQQENEYKYLPRAKKEI